MKYLISNLKANFTLNDMKVYQKALLNIDETKINFIVCPSAPYLYLFQDTNITIGAQDVSVYQKGAYTGEVTAKQYASMGCTYAIVGHYERRKYFHDSDKVISTKIKNCFKSKLKVILCIGESTTDLKNNEVLESLENQIVNVLNDFDKEELKNIIIAYEPLWAIGTKAIPTKKAIVSTVQYIKKIINKRYHLELPIVYGGSVDEDNVNEIKKIKEIDGLVIGASSLNVNSLLNIINKI